MITLGSAPIVLNTSPAKTKPATAMGKEMGSEIKITCPIATRACAMFPSPSAGSCDIVMPQTVKQARGMTGMPIFVSGGITPENIQLLKKETPFDGVAVISGILSAAHPQQKVKEYKDALGI